MPSPPAESAGAPGSPPYADLPGPDVRADADSAWVSRQVQAMAAAWSRGERVTAVELMARLPGLGDEAAIRLIYEEVCLRRDAGQDIATTEVVSRFPRWKDELEVLLGCDRMLRPFSRVAAFPEAGEDLGPFRLLAEFGRGASGRTYLAAEPALADRMVVLKVISDDQEEHLSLARLQHTHIIPLFSEQTFAERGLRALCMPYLGGTSLARILEGLSEIPPGQRRGRNILDVLDRVQANHPVPWNSDGPYRRYLEEATYVQAVCWIGACLADALHSAHAHGLIHMDVKPSNVLIAADGLPMLLDFHLARRPMRAGERINDRLGGTPGWMAPEHRAAMGAVSLGEPIAEQVDRRADLYALGLLLCEALGGPGAAQDATSKGPWRERNPEVSLGLTDIIEKSKASKPCDRYGDALALSEDLRRELNDLPLRGVPNRSLVESWRKWRRRRPVAFLRGAAWLATAAACAGALILAQAFYRQRVHDIREIEIALADGTRQRTLGHFDVAAQILGRGLEHAATLPAVRQMASELSTQLRLARRGQKAAALHDLAELVRFRYGIDLPGAEEAQALVRNIGALWNERELLLAKDPDTLDQKIDQAIRADLLDLAIAWAELRVRLGTNSDAGRARADALLVLDQANTLCGPSPRLDRLQVTIAGGPGQVDPRQVPAPAAFSALDHYDMGRSYLRAGAFREATREFGRVLDERPQDFWPNFYQGLCAFRLGQFPEALSAFRICTALAPRSAECYYNRALAADALGHFDEAWRNYSRALEFDRSLARALLNRGVLAYKKGRHDDAISDFRRALRAAADAETIGRIHFNLSLAYFARGDRPEALASAQEALARGHDAARGLCDRLRQKP